MTDRVLSALRGLGIGTPPAAVLEREDAFFALLPDALVYQDPGGTRRVTLRDLTRIHSDQEGQLRVETPAGTALTATLVGFDPAGVQAFFAQVRDATAQAKNLPPAPLPAAGGLKTFGSVPPPAAAPAQPTGAAQSTGAARPSTPVPSPVAVRSAAEPSPTAPEPPPIVLGAGPGPAPTPQSGTVREVRSTQPDLQETGAREKRTEQPSSPCAAPSPPDHAAEPDRAETAQAGSVLAALQSRASAVAGLVSRLRLLGAVLGLAAVGLAVFQFLGGTPLLGLWTLIAGGVGCIALFVFADVTRLIVSLARAVAEGGQGHGRSG